SDSSGTQGPSQPQGPDANTYTYNSATGMWENQYYIWNPATGQTTPKTPQNYSYNPATGMWDTTQYRYDAASGTYVPNVVSSSVKPAALTVSNSGPGSSNNLNSNTTNNGTFNNFYNASISNNIGSLAVTGSASVLSNTNGGDATSGNALAMANV